MAKKSKLSKDEIIRTGLVGIGAAGIATAAWFAAKRYKQQTGRDLIIPAILVGGPIGTVVMNLLIESTD